MASVETDSTTASGRWKLVSQDGIDEALQYDASYIATEAHLGPEDVLVDLYAASLNYRDIAIAKVSLFVVISFWCQRLLLSPPSFGTGRAV